MSLLTVVFWALLLPKITNLVCLISVRVLIWEKWADLLRNDRNSLRAPGTGHICLLNSACWLWVEWRLENSVGKYDTVGYTSEYLKAFCFSVLFIPPFVSYFCERILCHYVIIKCNQWEPWGVRWFNSLVKKSSNSICISSLGS